MHIKVWYYVIAGSGYAGEARGGRRSATRRR